MNEKTYLAGGPIRLSVAQLMRETGMSRRSVQRGLRDLEEAGLLRIMPRPGEENLYVPLLPIEEP